MNQEMPEFIRDHRPHWEISEGLARVSARLESIEPLVGMRDHFLTAVAEAFDSGDSGAFAMASRTYDEVAAHDRLQDEQRALMAEIHRHPHHLAHEIGRVALTAVLR